ncbi:hypothetical protein Tco_1380553 [Tanacetum coccineum]
MQTNSLRLHLLTLITLWLAEDYRARPKGSFLLGPDLTTPLNQSGGGETFGRNNENPPDTRSNMEGHISALKELLKQPSNHDLIKPMLQDFSDEIQDTDEEDREAERVNVRGKAVVANDDLGKPFKLVLKCPFTRRIYEFSAPKH